MTEASAHGVLRIVMWNTSRFVAQLVALVGLGVFSACASRSSDAAPSANVSVASSAFFACMQHCTQKGRQQGTCSRYDRDVPLACEIFHEENIRSEDQDYVVEQYRPCMGTCKRPTDDGVFCEKFQDNTTEICRAFYGVN